MTTSGTSHRKRRAVPLLALLVVCGLLSACGWVDRATGRPVTKVLLVGDSVMWGAALEIAEEFNARGIEVHYVGYAATGPLWADRRWADWTRAEVATFAPDLVIFEACCVYPGPFIEPHGGGALTLDSQGNPIAPDSEEMFIAWEQAARELIQIAQDAGASVWWVEMLRGLEPARYYGPLFPERINRINEINDSLGVPIVDWDGAIYAQPDPNAFRAPDGVHPNAAGYDLIGRYTFDATVEPAPDPADDVLSLR